MTVLKFTRAIIGAATSLHIAALRLAVKLADKRHELKVRATDAAVTAAYTAKRLADMADDNALAASAAETASLYKTRNFRDAAQLEANSLRRGVTL